MNDTLMNEIFSAVVDGPPPARFDVERAIRLGRRRRVVRATSVVVSLALVVVAVTGSVVALTRSAPTPPAAAAVAVPPCTASEVTSRQGALVISNVTHVAIQGIEFTARVKCSLPGGRPRVERTGADGSKVLVPAYTFHDPALTVHDPSQLLIVDPEHPAWVRVTWVGDPAIDTWESCPASPVEVVLGDVRAIVDARCRATDIGIAGPASIELHGGLDITADPSPNLTASR
jgi:hypothetical protein